MSTSDFTVGEIVDVRNYGRAEVVEPIVTEAGSRFYGRIRIKYQCDGNTYYARPENLRKTVQVWALKHIPGAQNAHPPAAANGLPFRTLSKLLLKPCNILSFTKHSNK
ncbi:hypothetical protein Vafri_8080 [Volvox africanus]|uniref:Uncharacterized protein n=1 Tax=Volvox africanus TaxID=51714 RepID=A0A8J4EZV1_9CHLO|nr:hypothetical protein Vafri_8080 [Volvox africanus]